MAETEVRPGGNSRLISPFGPTTGCPGAPTEFQSVLGYSKQKCSFKRSVTGNQDSFWHLWPLARTELPTGPNVCGFQPRKPCSCSGSFLHKTPQPVSLSCSHGGQPSYHTKLANSTFNRRLFPKIKAISWGRHPASTHSCVEKPPHKTGSAQRHVNSEEDLKNKMGASWDAQGTQDKSGEVGTPAWAWQAWFMKPDTSLHYESHKEAKDGWMDGA